MAEIIQMGAYITILLCAGIGLINAFINLRRARKIQYSPLYSDIIADLLAEKEKLEREHNITINFDAEETEDPYAKLDDTNENE